MANDGDRAAGGGTPIDWKSIPPLAGLAVTFRPTEAQLEAEQARGVQDHKVLSWRILLGAVVLVPVVVCLIFVVFVAPAIMWFWPRADTPPMFSSELSQWALGILGMIVGSAVTVSLGSMSRTEKNSQ